MILEISEQSPVWVRGAATAILILHISAGSTALVSGTAAFSFRKGSHMHRMAGSIFFVSMLITSVIGACVGPFLPQPQWQNLVAGIFTFYLVVTAWWTVTREEGTTGSFEVAALVAALSIAATTVFFSVTTSKRVENLLVAAVVLLAAAGDLRVILHGGIVGGQRIARHLWRMSVAFFLAAGAFFPGQQKLFPAFLHGSPVLYVPQLVVLALLVFWLLRVRLSKRFKADQKSSESPAAFVRES